MNKMIVVLAVVIVAAVGITAVLIPGGEQEEPLPDFGEQIGLVYGNADGDFEIDEQDVRIIESIIAGEKSLDDFPLADANCDENVDQLDLDMLDKYFAKEDIRLHVVESPKNIVEVKYPINHVMLMPVSGFGSVVNVFDVYDRLTGVAVEDFVEVRDNKMKQLYEDEKIIKVDPWGTSASNDLITKTPTEVLISQIHGMWYLDSDDNVKTLNGYGIDVLRLDFSKPETQASAMATAGIVLDQTEQAKGYAEFMDKVVKTIKEKEGDKFGTKTTMMNVGHGWAAKKLSYNKFMETAGGKNLITDNESFKPYHEQDQWIFEEKYQADVMFMAPSKTGGYANPGFTDISLSKFDSFKDMPAWKNGKVFAIDTTVPPIILIAYLAECMYPECFEEGWADSIHQEFVDKYFDPVLKYKVPSGFVEQIN